MKIRPFKCFGLLVLLMVSSVACSDYNRILKSDDLDEKFSLANELYANKNYDRSIVLFEQVYQNAPKSQQGEQSFFNLSQAYYESGDYAMAAYYFAAFIQRYPYSLKTESAVFMNAMCNVNNSPKWSLDQTDTYVAINSLQSFVDKFPNSVLIDSCNQLMDGLILKLEIKEYNKILLYDKTDNFKAAFSAADIFVENYPQSDFIPDVAYISVLNCYHLAMNSIESKKKERIEETIQRYLTFVVNYPDSQKIKELSGLLNKWRKDYEF